MWPVTRVATFLKARGSACVAGRMKGIRHRWMQCERRIGRIPFMGPARTFPDIRSLPTPGRKKPS